MRINSDKWIRKTGEDAGFSFQEYLKKFKDENTLSSVKWRYKVMTFGQRWTYLSVSGILTCLIIRFMNVKPDLLLGIYIFLFLFSLACVYVETKDKE